MSPDVAETIAPNLRPPGSAGPVRTVPVPGPPRTQPSGADEGPLVQEIRSGLRSLGRGVNADVPQPAPSKMTAAAAIARTRPRRRSSDVVELSDVVLEHAPVPCCRRRQAARDDPVAQRRIAADLMDQSHRLLRLSRLIEQAVLAVAQVFRIAR